METASIKLDDGTGKEFDEAIKDSKENGFPEMADLEFITKDEPQEGVSDCVMIRFSVMTPEGPKKVQAVTTAKIMATLGRALEGKYPGLLA